MEPQSVTLTQHTATPVRTKTVCVECGYPGPHHVINGRWTECGRTPIQMGPRMWIGGCGATWRTAFDDLIVPDDQFTDRLIDIIDATDVGVVDTPRGLILAWDSALDLARRIATDTQLTTLVRQRELGGAA